MTKVNSSRLGPRAKVLVEAVRQVTDEKEKLYGDPRVNLSCAGELKRVFLRYAVRSARTVGPAEQDAIDQALSKIARIATGPSLVEDNYTDCAGYVAIAYECALLGSREPRDIMEAAAGEDLNEFDISDDEILGTEGRQDLLDRGGSGSGGDDAGNSLRGFLRKRTPPDASSGGDSS